MATLSNRNNKLAFVQCARVDTRVPIENAIETLSGFIKEGKFDHIGMSECSAATLRDRKSTRLNSSHSGESRMPSSA